MLYKTVHKRGLVAHAWKIEREGQNDQKVKTSLSSTESLKPAWAICDTISKNRKQGKTNNKTPIFVSLAFSMCPH